MCDDLRISVKHDFSHAVVVYSVTFAINDMKNLHYCL